MLTIARIVGVLLLFIMSTSVSYLTVYMFENTTSLSISRNPILDKWARATMHVLAIEEFTPVNTVVQRLIVSIIVQVVVMAFYCLYVF